MKLVPAAIVSCALLLAACGPTYAFPLKAPTSDVLDANYQALRHTLADNDDYHFSMLLPNEWKILQTTVARRPEGEQPLEIALFREPGAWMENEDAGPEGEVLVEVFTTSGSALGSGSAGYAPMAWLKRKIDQGMGDAKIVKQRTYESLYGPAADLLVRSGAGDQTIVSRFAAIRSPNNPDQIFVIVSSATEAGYERVAEAFATAIDTFRLENVDKEETGSGAKI
jgi:hypothetical protein